MNFLLVVFISLIIITEIHPQEVNFVKSSQNFPPSETFQVALGDLDKDNDLDIVFSNNSFNNSTVWFNDGNGHFTNSGQLLTQQGHGIGLGDLNGDNHLDLFIPCAIIEQNNEFYYRPSKIYFNDGSGSFNDSGQNLGDSLESKTFVDLVDYDFDDDLDAVVQHFEMPSRIYYKVYENDATGNFSLSELSLPDNSSPNWADLDNDGDSDIFMKLENEGYSTLINDGNGNFSTHWEFSDTSATLDLRCVELTDFDGDHDLDAFIINRGGANGLPALVFLNDGTGQFTDTGQHLGLFNWSWVESRDVDTDNDSDIVISIFGGPMQVWLNDGSGYFTDSGLRLGGNNPYRGMDLGDLDNDGDVDIFIAYYGQGSNEIWFNDIINLVEDKHGEIHKTPSKFQLFQNYPNPFNLTTKISYSIPRRDFITVKVFNVLGNEITVLVDEERDSGHYEIEFDATGLSSGMYFYRLRTNSFCEIKKMILMK